MGASVGAQKPVSLQELGEVSQRRRLLRWVPKDEEGLARLNWGRYLSQRNKQPCVQIVLKGPV